MEHNSADWIDHESKGIDSIEYGPIMMASNINHEGVDGINHNDVVDGINHDGIHHALIIKV